MASYTIETLPEHDLALSCIVEELNKVKKAEVDLWNSAHPKELLTYESLTNEDYIKARVEDLLAGYTKQHAEDLFNQAIDKYEKASDDDRNAVLENLGMAEYSKVPLECQKEVLAAFAITKFTALDNKRKESIFSRLKM